MNPPDAEDIIDEALFYFRANVLFRNFEVCIIPLRILTLAGGNKTVGSGAAGSEGSEVKGGLSCKLSCVT